jgi:hypothetical protein
MSAFAIPTLVDAAIDQMLSLDRHFELNLWPPHSIADRRHDIGLMASHDLVALTTELLSASNVVLFEFVIRMEQFDPTGEVHWPVLDRARVANGRLLVQRHGNKEAAYRDKLRLSWSAAASLDREPGDACVAGDGGGLFHLGQAHRRHLVVTQAGPRFAFADFADSTGPAAQVFLLQQWAAEPRLTFHVGQRLTALCVATKKGLQARAIRAD